MFFDDAVVAGLIIVVLTLGIFVSMGCFAYRHINEDTTQHRGESKEG
ncbi:MAG: hypothetical protein ACJA0N_001401 [Pseudohongiellaceae bacterium]|jgi:hypothetical protein